MSRQGVKKHRPQRNLFQHSSCIPNRFTLRTYLLPYICFKVSSASEFNSLQQPRGRFHVDSQADYCTNEMESSYGQSCPSKYFYCKIAYASRSFTRIKIFIDFCLDSRELGSSNRGQLQLTRAPLPQSTRHQFVSTESVASVVYER